MDRFTWGVVGGVIGICLIALGSVVFSRTREGPPDFSTPEGVALAYAIAIQNHEPDRAWDLLASPEAAGFPGPFGRPFEPPPPVSTPPPSAAAGTPGATAAIPTPVAAAAPPRSSITQEQFRQAVYKNPRRTQGKRLRITGMTTITEGRARVEMEITTADSVRFPLFGFGGAVNSFNVTFELQRQGSTWRITSAPPVFNFL